jgi:hypothetical protein
LRIGKKNMKLFNQRRSQHDISYESCLYNKKFLQLYYLNFDKALTVDY